MKLSTLAVLSTLGMALTSASVWGLTPAAVAASGRPAPTSVAAPAGGSSTPGLLSELLGDRQARGSTFSVGETLHVNGRLGHAKLDGTRSGETYMLLTLSADRTQQAATAAPVNLAIVMDRSRSMEGQRMTNAVEAARGMVRRLREGDTVSIVTYNSTTELLVPATTIDARSRGDILFALRDVEARGHTCISCGIEAGITAMARRTGAVNRMLLLSDGEANFGVRDVDGFRRIAETARERDIAISTLGVDVDYNERVMVAVAQASTGRHYFVENTASLPRIFDQELASLVSTVANDAQVEVELAPGVTAVEVLDRSFRREGNTLLVPFGAFSPGDEKTLLVRLSISAGSGAEQPVAAVRARFDDLVLDRRGECAGELFVARTDAASADRELDPVVEARVARSETAASLARANALFNAGDAAAAQRELGENRGRIRTRSQRAKKKATGGLGKKLDGDFQLQLKSLDEAEQGFADAPAPSSRAGKAQVRSNAGQLDDLLQ